MPRTRPDRWYYEGYEFKSRIEQTVGKQLLSLKIPFEYETNSFGYTVKNTHGYCADCGSPNSVVDRSYTPDFFLPNGVIIECKGKFTATERKKHVAMREQHPDLDLRILFQQNSYLQKKQHRGDKSKRYGDWCDSKDIKWACGIRLPEEWLEEI